MMTIIVLLGVIPSATEQMTDDNYVDSLFLHKPDVDDGFYERYVDELLLLDFMEMLGQTQPVKQTTYTHFEKPQLLNYINCAAGQSDPGADQPITITLQHDNHLVSGTKSVPRLNDQVLINNIQGVIYSMNKATPFAHTITVYPAKLGATFGVTATGDSVIIYSNVWPAGTGGSTSLTWDAIRYQNTCKISKEMFEVEGSEMTNESYIKVTMPDGSSGYVYYYDGEENTYRHFRVAMEHDLILTDQITNAFLVAAGYRAGENMIPYITNKGGVVYNYNAGAMTLAEHKKMLKQLDKGGTYANEYAFMQGIDLNDEYQNWITTTMQNGAISYGGFNAGGKEMAIKMDFSSFETLGYTFHMKRYRLFNNQNSLGAPGLNYPGTGIAIPMRTTVHPVSGKNVPYMRLRNKSLAGYDRGMEHFYLGGAGIRVKTSAVDRKESHYRGENSVEFFAANQWVLMNRL